MNWKLYYADGSTFSSDQGATYESPISGAVLVAQTTGEPSIACNATYLLYRNDLGMWFACDRAGYDDQQTHFAQMITCVRIGRWMPTPDYMAIKQRALEELRGARV